MRGIARTALIGAVIATSLPALATGGAATAGAQPGAAASTPLPFVQTLRRCDFSALSNVGPSGYGRAFGQMRTGGSEIVADVQFATGVPNMRYDVRVIQAPRSAAQTCNAGDPGVAAGFLMTDAAGVGSTTVRAPKLSGATGAWVFISRPGMYTQTPAEFYTSDAIIPF